MFKNMSRTVRTGILAAITLGVVAVVAVAVVSFTGSPRASAVNVNSESVAIHGYDTVAYFTEGKPTKGSSEYRHEWQGATWHFASSANRDLFAANPERYAPRYGGYCSMGLAIGEYSDADPEMWTIIDGKLYLNKNERVQAMWREGPNAYIVASELNWAKYRDELRINESLKR